MSDDKNEELGKCSIPLNQLKGNSGAKLSYPIEGGQIHVQPFFITQSDIPAPVSGDFTVIEPAVSDEMFKNSSIWGIKLHDLINKHRQDNNLEPYKWSQMLSEVCSQNSKVCLPQGYNDWDTQMERWEKWIESTNSFSTKFSEDWCCTKNHDPVNLAFNELKVGDEFLNPDANYIGIGWAYGKGEEGEMAAFGNVNYLLVEEAPVPPCCS